MPRPQPTPAEASSLAQRLAGSIFTATSRTLSGAVRYREGRRGPVVRLLEHRPAALQRTPLENLHYTPSSTPQPGG
jgi:hypothetical protein